MKNVHAKWRVISRNDDGGEIEYTFTCPYCHDLNYDTAFSLNSVDGDPFDDPSYTELSCNNCGKEVMVYFD